MWYCSIKIQYIRIIPIPILGLRSLQARSLRREMRCWTLKMHHICIETRNPIYLVMGTVSIQTGWALAYPKNGGKHLVVSDAFSKTNLTILMATQFLNCNAILVLTNTIMTREAAMYAEDEVQRLTK